MSDTVVHVENLSKCYVLSHQRGARDGLRHQIERFTRSPLNWLRELRGGGESKEQFWALRDVNFELNEGEVLGIVGRNGAGKSTLLKILSRITEPTSGRIRLRGRVASLLEVGTGFHQDLTGRENIFLNGSILGMTKVEIKRKFDEIVAFSEIEQFLDTPVKRYSSGMYVRLAFAVAAHLEPEILIVDEVLAVGDAEFQKKCLGKISQVASGGRTVLFVSHNMASLATLCTRGILLSGGRKVADGDINEVISSYFGTARRGQVTYLGGDLEKSVYISRIDVPSLDEGGIHVSGAALRIRIEIRSRSSIRKGCVAVQVMNYLNVPVLHFRAYDQGVFIEGEGETVLECELSECWLNVGPYRLDVYLADPPGGEVHEVLTGVCPFDVQVRHATSWFGWTKESCCYIQNESWHHLSADRSLAAP